MHDLFVVIHENYLSVPAMIVIALVLTTIITLMIIASNKKKRAMDLYISNIRSLPPEDQDLFESTKRRDATWFDRIGNALDASEPSNPMEVAIDAGWTALDNAEELLREPEFATKAELRKEFRGHLDEANEQFALAEERYADELAREDV